MRDAATQVIIRDPQHGGMPIIQSLGEVQRRAMVERGQQVVQDLEAKLRFQSEVIQHMRSVLALLLLEAEDEFMQFDLREFEQLKDREVDDRFIDTVDGRRLWRIWLVGEKADAAMKGEDVGLHLVGGTSK